jgi:hypothetical protein
MFTQDGTAKAFMKSSPMASDSQLSLDLKSRLKVTPPLSLHTLLLEQHIHIVDRSVWFALDGELRRILHNQTPATGVPPNASLKLGKLRTMTRK